MGKEVRGRTIRIKAEKEEEDVRRRFLGKKAKIYEKKGE
jgi:hypothetical protein